MVMQAGATAEGYVGSRGAIYHGVVYKNVVNGLLVKQRVECLTWKGAIMRVVVRGAMIDDALASLFLIQDRPLSYPRLQKGRAERVEDKLAWRPVLHHRS